MDRGVVGDVVAVVTKRRGIEGEEPDRGHPEVPHVVQLLGETPEVTPSVGVGVVKRPDVDLIDEGVLVPLGVGVERSGIGLARQSVAPGLRRA